MPFVAVGFFWPWIKRFRVGFKPPDAELRKALDARDAWTKNFEAQQQETKQLHAVRERQLQTIDELKQEIEALRSENEQLIAGNERFGTQSGDDELKKRAGRLSDDLFRFAQERDKGAPPEVVPKMSGGFWNTIMESAADPKMQERTNYDNETRRQYGEMYGGDVGALLDALERRGWFDAGERKALEEQTENEFVSPTPPIRQIAQRLAAIGKRL